MFELPSAIFNSRWQRVQFARFYIICEEVPLGTSESPLIVCGFGYTSSVQIGTRRWDATAWKYVNFASKNFPPSVYSGTFLFSGILIIYLSPQRGLCLLRQFQIPIVFHLLNLPLICRFHIDRAPFDLGVLHSLEDFSAVLSRHLHEGILVVHVDRADQLAWHAGLPGDRTENVSRLDAVFYRC